MYDDYYKACFSLKNKFLTNILLTVFNGSRSYAKLT